MKNIKKYLIALVLVLCGFLLVSCGEPVPEPEPEPEPIKIATIEVYPTIYDGKEDAPYVLVDQEIYIEAECLGADEATPDELEVWSIDNPAIAEMKVNEEGGIICKGLKAGNATVTAKSPDGSVSASLTFEVAISASAQDVLVAANNEIDAKFPKFVSADTTLPVSDNPNVKVAYKSNKTNGITVENGVYKYAWSEEKGDVNKQINYTLTYHGEKLECNGYFYEVKDAENNQFRAVEKVEAKLHEFFGDKVLNLEDKTKTALVSADLALPTAYTAEEVGADVTLTWTSDTPAYITDAGVYKKGAVDKIVLLTATVNIGGKPVSKVAISVIAAGATIDEVLEHMMKNGLIPDYEYETSSSSIALAVKDTKNIYPGLSVEWEIDEDSATACRLNKSKTGYNLLIAASGEFTVYGTFYYNKQELVQDVPVVDGNGNPVIDETTGEQKVEQQTTISYAWMVKKEFTITKN